MASRTVSCRRISASLAGLLLWSGLAFGLAQPARPPRIDRAISLAVDGDYPAALVLFKAELSKSPEDPLLNYYVAITRFKMEDIDAAIVHFEKSVAEKAPFPQAFYWLTLAYLEKDREEAAIETLRKGLDRFPLNRDLTTLAAELDLEDRPPR